MATQYKSSAAFPTTSARAETIAKNISPGHLNVQQENVNKGSSFEQSTNARRTKSATLVDDSNISEHTDMFAFKFQIPRDRVWEYR